jgi:general secretion pathway protein D
MIPFSSRSGLRKALAWGIGVTVVMLSFLSPAWAEEPLAPPPQEEPSSTPPSQEQRSGGAEEQRNEGVTSAPDHLSTPAQTPQGEERVTLNFEDADIRAVIHSFATALGIHYTPDPRVQGKVTIRTTEPIPKRDLLPLFHHILRSNGLAAVKVGDVYQIIPVGEAKTKVLFSKPALSPAEGTAPERQGAEAEDGFVIELVKVEHMAAAEMVSAIQPFVSPGGDIVTYAPGNLLIITDLASNVQRLKDVIAAFDANAVRESLTRVYRIQHANVEKLGEEIKQVLAASTAMSGNTKDNSVSVVPLPRLSSVVVITSNPAIFPQIQRWVEELDVPAINQLKLVGAFIVPGQEEALLLDSSQDGKKAILRVKIGEKIGRYKLGKVDRAAVVLIGPGGDEVSLPLAVLAGEEAAKAPRMAVTPPPPPEQQK